MDDFEIICSALLVKDEVIATVSIIMAERNLNLNHFIIN